MNTITVQIPETGRYTLTEIQERVQMYIAALLNPRPSMSDFYGKACFTQNPLQFQRDIRDEW